MNLLNINIILVLILFSINIYTQEADLILKTKAYDLAEDKEGNIWVGTTEGVFKINPNDFTYKQFTTNEGLPNNDIWRVISFGNKIWLLTRSKYQGYIKNDSIYTYITPYNTTVKPKTFHKYQNRLFVVYYTGTRQDKYYGVRIMELNGNIWENIKINENYNLSKEYFLPHNNSTLSINENELIVKSKTESKNIRVHIPNFIPNLPSKIGLRDNIFFQTCKNGILFVDIEKFKAKFIEIPYRYNFGKGSKVIYNDSLIQLYYKGSLFFLINQNFNIEKQYNLSQFNPNHILLDINKNIWIANDRGVHFIPSTSLSVNYHLENRSIIHIDTLNNNVIASTKNNIFKYDSIYRIIWSNTGSSVISPKKLINNKASITEVMNYTKEKIVRDYVRIGDKEWITKLKYLVYKKPNGNIIKNIFSGLLQLQVYRNNIYVTSNEGLLKIQNDTNLIKIAIDGVSIRNITSFKDKLILGTDGLGIYLYDEDTIQKLPILQKAIINQIKIYDSLVWLATNQGIKVLDIDFQNPENSKIVNSFIEEDGLKVNYSNCLLLYDSNLYIGCESGISVLDLRNSYYYQKPKISFDTRFIKQQNKLPIEFEFHSHKPMSYFYSLDNQKSWTKIDGKRFQLNDLDKENTNISFKAINHHQIENIVDYQIKVKFEWYQKTSWQIVLGIAGSILLYLFFRLGYNISQKRTQKRIELRHQLNNLKLEALRSQMNPHFVNNALNSILYLIQEKDAGFAEKYLIKFARLMRLYFNFSSAEFITIQEELEVINTYISIEKLRFEDKFDFKIDIDEEIDIESEEIPSLITQPFIENAINHGIFHIKHKGLIKLSFKRLEDDSLCISIWDNGIGYLKSLDKKEEDNDKHSSKTITDRIETLNNIQKYNVESSIHDHGHGTEIKILIRE